MTGVPNHKTDLLVDRTHPWAKRVIARPDAVNRLWRSKISEAPVDPRGVCTSPVMLPAIGLPSAVLGESSQPLPLDYVVRCRHCEGCLNHRRRVWTARSMDMIRASSRTWFGTLTVRPAERIALRYRAELRWGITLSSLDQSEQFGYLAKMLGTELTLWLKRVRASGAPFRYLAVAEEHKTGDPHIHILLHEMGKTITKRVLEDRWRFGFSHWRLVGNDEKAASYVTKYLAKDLRTRVRASKEYGRTEAVRALTERMSNMSDTVLSSERTMESGNERRGTGTRGFSREGVERSEMVMKDE